MEFILTTSFKPSITPEQQRELLTVFSQWQPPDGVDMKMLYISVDQRHSFGLFEAESAAPIMEVTSTFSDYLDFQVFPVLAAPEGAELMGKSQAWVDGVKAG